ncbi:MAG: CoA-binding protein [Acidimicrobiia bacterium]
MTLEAAMRRGLDALFDPRGVIVAGASTHPGKFGAVVLHNVLAHGYAGPVFATNPEAAARGDRLFGITLSASIDDVPAGSAELAVLCTPVGANVDVLRACAAKGVRAVFVMTAGYRETGAEGRAAEGELVRVGAELGVLVAGPNGQGLVSTPSALCAQMVAPYPPRGSIGIASQSGNLVSVLENLAVHSGVGVSRAVSAGNAAAVGVADYLDYFADDPETAVGIAYLEGVDDGRELYERLRAVTPQLPVVLVKGGATEQGSRAAAAHTGALATDDHAFTSMCTQAGVMLAAAVDEAFDVAALFATQPLPKGPNTVVVTNAGGWGVLTADAIARSTLTLLDLPDDLRTAIDTKLPPRWSGANPIDLAAGETRDTIPEILELVASHPAVDAVVFVGLGAQSNTARVLREGPFATHAGVERIASFHERQDARYANVVADVAASTGTPVLCATELAVSNPENSGVRTMRDRGQYIWWSAPRAVRSLEHAWGYVRRLDADATGGLR